VHDRYRSRERTCPAAKSSRLRMRDTREPAASEAPG
jgi:hypothetical protein